MRAEIIILVSVILSSISAVDKATDDECAVVDGVQKFTFKEIDTDLGFHIDKYSFNLCKSLSRKCNNQTAAACYRKSDSKEVVIGFTRKLSWNDGQISITYEGEKCDENRNYTTSVILHCDYFSTTKNDFLGVFHSETECDVNIFMRTPKACLPLPDNVKNANLIVKTPKGNFLNFKSLQSSNHEVIGSKDFHIGFPILYGHNMLCEAGTFVCFVNSSESDPHKKYLNMGTMTSNFKYEKNRAILQLSSTEICENNKTYASQIVFECDNLISGDGSPSFKGTVDCVHRFLWQTSLACETPEKSCTLTTNDGNHYDFSSLSGVQYKAVHPSKLDKAIYFSICTPAKSSICDGMIGVGSCIVIDKDNQQRQITNAGNYNSTLQIDDSKNVFLLYENGARCNADGRKFSTKIEFIVADDEEDEVSVLVEDDCEIVLQFKTLLANANIKPCTVKTSNDEEIDLSRLIDLEGNYVAEVNGKNLPNETSENIQYLLNVCKPLNSKYSLNCIGNTAACRTVMIDDKHEEELSLGHFDYSMSTEERKEDNTTAVIMKYFKGSICPSDSEEHILTKVTFFCNETTGLGNPILQSIEHCVYSFDFPTSILCNDRVISMKDDETSCELFNEKLNVSVDLKPIGILNSGELPMKRIDICDRSMKKRFTINYRQSMILVQYDKTSNPDYQRVEIQLKCGVSNKTMAIVTEDEILVTHESILICQLLNIKLKSSMIPELVLNEKSETNNTNSGGFSMGYLFLVIILILAFVAFYLVIKNPERREIIRNMIKFRSRSNNVRYSRNMNDDELILN